MAAAFAMLLLFELRDDLLYFFDMVYFGNEDGLGGFENDGVIEFDFFKLLGGKEAILFILNE